MSSTTFAGEYHARMETKKTERVGLVLSAEELEQIDDWRFDSRIGSRSEAIRRLIQAGLEAQKQTETAA